MMRGLGCGLTSAITSSGALNRTTGKAPSSNYSGVGSLTRGIGRSISSAASWGGGLVRSIGKTIAGAFSGLVDLVSEYTHGSTVYPVDIASSIAFAGAVTRGIAKYTTSAIGMTGSLSRNISRTVRGTYSGASALVAILVHEAIQVAIASVFSAAGSIDRSITKQLSSGIQSTGRVTRLTSKFLAAVFTPAQVLLHWIVPILKFELVVTVEDHAGTITVEDSTGYIEVDS
jgi:hypothetical protein